MNQIADVKSVVPIDVGGSGICVVAVQKPFAHNHKVV